jgi:hypothetical protein
MHFASSCHLFCVRLKSDFRRAVVFLIVRLKRSGGQGLIDWTDAGAVKTAVLVAHSEHHLDEMLECKCAIGRIIPPSILIRTDAVIE